MPSEYAVRRWETPVSPEDRTHPAPNSGCCAESSPAPGRWGQELSAQHCPHEGVDQRGGGQDLQSLGASTFSFKFQGQFLGQGEFIKE